MNRFNDYTELAGRILIAAIFLLSGLTKITGYTGTVAYMESYGVPGPLLPLAIIVEVLGAAAIMLGLWTRAAAAALAVFSVVAAVFFHANFADPVQQIMFLKNLAIAGGLLVLWANGPGRLSLDQRRAGMAPSRRFP